jgi:hypothetical protein
MELRNSLLLFTCFCMHHSFLSVSAIYDVDDGHAGCFRCWSLQGVNHSTRIKIGLVPSKQAEQLGAKTLQHVKNQNVWWCGRARLYELPSSLWQFWFKFAEVQGEETWINVSKYALSHSIPCHHVYQKILGCRFKGPQDCPSCEPNKAAGKSKGYKAHLYQAISDRMVSIVGPIVILFQESAFHKFTRAGCDESRVAQ